MNILAMANASTFVAHRKYFHRPSQVLSFLAGISVKKLRKWRAVYFDKVSSQSGWNLEMYKNKKSLASCNLQGFDLRFKMGLNQRPPD